MPSPPFKAFHNCGFLASAHLRNQDRPGVFKGQDHHVFCLSIGGPGSSEEVVRLHKVQGLQRGSTPPQAENVMVRR